MPETLHFAQDKALSSGELSPEVMDRVKGMVRSAVLQHWLLDSNGQVRADVKSDLKKDVQDSTATSQQEAVESRVRAAVSAAVNSNAPSKVACSSPALLSRSPMSTLELARRNLFWRRVMLTSPSHWLNMNAAGGRVRDKRSAENH